MQLWVKDFLDSLENSICQRLDRFADALERANPPGGWEYDDAYASDFRHYEGWEIQQAYYDPELGVIRYIMRRPCQEPQPDPELVALHDAILRLYHETGTFDVDGMTVSQVLAGIGGRFNALEQRQTKALEALQALWEDLSETDRNLLDEEITVLVENALAGD